MQSYLNQQSQKNSIFPISLRMRMTRTSYSHPFFIMIFLSIFYAVSSYASAGMPMPIPAAGGKPGDTQQISPDDLKLLEEVNQEINKFVESLPAAEQQSFWKEVDELTQVMSKMSEDELVSFMSKVLSEEAGGAPMPTIPTGAQVIAQPTPIAPAVVIPTPEPTKPLDLSAAKKIEQTLAMLDDIIKSINNFLSKSQIIPELSNYVQSWAQEKAITSLPPQTTWKTFKDQISLLEQHLNHAKEREVRSGNYKHLPDLIKNESLMRELNLLRQELHMHEPLIQLPESLLTKISKPTKAAIRSVITTLAHALFDVDMIKKLQELFAGYEPIAGKLKETEEAHAKAALVRPAPRPGEGVVAGYVSTYPEPFIPYTPSSYEGTTPTFDFGRPSAPGTTETTPSKPTPPGAGAKPAETKKDEEKKKEDIKEDKLAQSLTTNIQEKLDSLQDIIDSSPDLSKLSSYMFSEKEVRQSTIESVNKVSKVIREATNYLRRLKRRLSKPDLTTTQKKMYKDEGRTILKDYRESLDKLQNTISSIKNDADRVTDIHKRYALMGGLRPEERDENKWPESFKKLRASVPEPANIFDILDRINDLKKAFEKLD